MPKRIAPLTDIQVSKAKSKNTDYKLSDGGGLHLLVTTSGGKLWRLQYRFDGKQKMLAMGQYPAVSLSDARQRRDDAKKLLSNGTDPAAVMSKQAKKQQQAAIVEAEQVALESTFEYVARAWHEKFRGTWTEHHATKIISQLEREVFPALGGCDISRIEAPGLLAVLQQIAARPALDAAHRVRSHCGAVFRYGIATGKAKRDPTRDLKGALPPTKYGHRAAPTKPKDVAQILRVIEAYDGSFIVKCALRLLPLVFVRPGELRHAEWSEINLESAEWSIPAGRMKMKNPHLVPLSRQAIAILEEIRPLTGSGRLVFPGIRSADRPISDMTLNAALRRLGIEKCELTSHGWRATARTLLHEELEFTPDAVEAQLAHVVPDRLGGAYNRTTHIAERRRMMQAWGDYLDGLKTGAKIIPLRQAA